MIDSRDLMNAYQDCKEQIEEGKHFGFMAVSDVGDTEINESEYQVKIIVSRVPKPKRIKSNFNNIRVEGTF
ncbi:MAG: hypothetical protein JJ958_06670 [Balneola sp.]|nr:hypothetical protein [Balneola sp.]